MGNNKKSGFVVMFENPKHPPKLIKQIKSIKEKSNTFLITIIHPNTSQALYESEHYCAGGFDEALVLAKEISEKPELLEVETWYEEKLFIPQPKKGKMKLKTQESVDSGEYYSEDPSKKRGRPKKDVEAEFNFVPVLVEEVTKKEVKVKSPKLKNNKKQAKVLKKEKKLPKKPKKKEKIAKTTKKIKKVKK